MNSLWDKGFRPFFSGASLFAVISILAWLAVYLHQAPLAFSTISSLQWHAHEMIFGYLLAVIAGFLLTAAANWTGRETASGQGLAALFGLWAAARIFLLAGDPLIYAAALADLSFIVFLSIAVIVPIARARQARQWPVVLVLLLFLTANASFYLCAILGATAWISTSIYAGFYLVLGLVLFMGSRVIPFFTQRGVGYEFTPTQRRWSDVMLFIAYVLFASLELVRPARPEIATAVIALAGLIFILMLIRLAGWYTPGIMKKPLLWTLHLSFALIALGFALRAFPAGLAVSPFIVVHAFSVGGFGLATLSMMTRVSLGHTGRSVHDAPKIAVVFMCVMLIAYLLRVVLATSLPQFYPWWVGLSGLAWALSFSLFAVAFLPKLARPRADAK